VFESTDDAGSDQFVFFYIVSDDHDCDHRGLL
jgi:hypothetical protein